MKKLLTLLTITLALSAQPMLAGGVHPPKKQAAKGMVKHIVLFKFKPETTPEKLNEILAAFEALPSKISQIKGFEWGTNNSPEKHDKGLTHAFILTFANAADRDAYLPHPAHKAFGGIVGPWLADVTVVDFTDKGVIK